MLEESLRLGITVPRPTGCMVSTPLISKTWEAVGIFGRGGIWSSMRAILRASMFTVVLSGESLASRSDWLLALQSE